MDVPPAPREMSEGATVMIEYDLQGRALVMALALVTFPLGAWLMLEAAPNAWIDLSPARTKGAALAPSSGPKRITISYSFEVENDTRYGEVYSTDRARFGELKYEDPVQVEYCSFWPGLSRLAGTTADPGASLPLGITLLTIALILGLVGMRKHRHIQRRRETYRLGIPTRGRSNGLEKKTQYVSNVHTSAWYLSYRYRPADADAELTGEVVARNGEDLEHLDGDDMIVLVHPQDPTRSIPYWALGARTP